MLTGWTFFRIPSRVPLSTLAPAKYPLEREEERPRRLELRQETRLIRLHEPVEQFAIEPLLVFREERSAHPLDHRFRTFQNMRIDDQTGLRIAESKSEQKACVGFHRQHHAGTAPGAQRGGE